MKSPNATIFYFSGTGNTWWCSQQISQTLSKLGIQTNMHSIERLTAKLVESLVAQSDIIGLGYPTYGSDIPQVMKEFIEGKLGHNTGNKKLFTFCTQMMFSGDGAWVDAPILGVKGWTIDWSAQIVMPNNICVPVIGFSFTNDRAKIDPILLRAGRKISAFAHAIATGGKYHNGGSVFSKPLGLLQRAPFRKMFPTMRNEVSIDTKKCITCLRCVQICPSGNLAHANGSFVFKSTCILCTRCYNYCPVQAIQYKGKVHDIRKGLPYQGPGSGFKPELICKEPIFLKPVGMEDWHKVRSLVWETFLEFEGPDYSPQGIETFHREVIEDESFFKKCSIWGAYAQGRLVSIMAIREGSHISLAFTEKSHQHQGLATSLFRTIVQSMEPGGPKLVTVHSSPYAVRFYQHLGFRATDTERVKNGIRFIPMVYELSFYSDPK